MQKDEKKYILAFDTANESIAIGIGELSQNTNDQCKIKLVGSTKIEAHRASNTLLVPSINEICTKHKIENQKIACVAAGRGPGSFTGVRISLASAKGISSALNASLIGFNTLDAVAWKCWLSGLRGLVYVVADAMRHEIYPALYDISEKNVERLSKTTVKRAEDAAEEAKDILNKSDNLYVCGDALFKYLDLFDFAKIANQEDWYPNGQSILLCLENAWKAAKIDPLDNTKFYPGKVLPVYTRLSDAEENERKKLAQLTSNLETGVRPPKDDQPQQYSYMPLSVDDTFEISKMEKELMNQDVWSQKQLQDELNQKNRIWWICKDNNKLIAYAGALITDDRMEVLKIAVLKNYQRQSIATKLISLLASDARDLAANKCSLELRQSNTAALNFYKNLGLKEISTRKNYYKGEDAIIMEGPLPIINKDVAGMRLEQNKNSSNINLEKPVILAIESSCDETAAAITCNGKVLADVVASQIAFHKRFGGVVPEIASRKHIEAICGVVDTCIKTAADNLNMPEFSWENIDAIAATYAPGLVGALVVGMAYTKGATWAINKPFIGVNHLEGHLYANKLNDEHIELPAVASIVSGGNTILVEVKNWGEYKTLGSTIDDAVGEAFDKVAKALNLGYPGGPIISKLAKKGDPNAIDFPRAMMHSGDFQFSLSGLKTAVVYYIDQHKNDMKIEDVCASFQQAVIDVAVEKAKTAILQTKSKSFLFGGGVAANPALREAYQKMCNNINVKLIMSPLSACGDNAAMIALVANDRYKQNKFFDLKKDVQAHASLDIPY